MSQNQDAFKAANMKTNWHPIACIFPMLPSEELQELSLDIEAHGQREPCLLFEGKILDGRNRWEACKIAGIEPKTKVIKTDDPLGLVMSLNLHRRHLSPSQAGMCAARAREFYDLQANQRMIDGKQIDPVENLPQGSGKARDIAGKAFGVSGKTVDHASKVLAQAIPEVVAAVDGGRMAVSTAAVLSTEPAEVQEQAIAGTANRNYAKTSGEKSAAEKADRLAKQVLKLDPRSRAAVLRRINSDDGVKAAKIKKITQSQRKGDGTPKDHVLTCVVDSFHNISSALQQNGPGTNARWISTCSDAEKRELRTFAANLASATETLSTFLNEKL